MGKFESYPSINNLDDDDITLYNHDTITHKVSFLRLANLIKLRVADQIPTQDSDNLVSSGGIYNALQSKADKATTLDGYGIEDAYNMRESDIRFLQKQVINPDDWDSTPTNGSNKPVTSDGIKHSIGLLAENTIKNGTCNIMPYPYNGFYTGQIHSLEVFPTGEIYIDYEAGYEFTYYLTKCSGNDAKLDVCQELCETLKNGVYVLYGVDDEYLKLMVDYYDASLNFISSQWVNDGECIRLQVPSNAKYVQVSIKADINHDFDDYVKPSICLESFFESTNNTPFAPCTKNNYQLSRALSVWNNDVATDFYFDYQNGKYGWNSSPSRGADTFHPFKQPATETKVITGKTTTDLGEDNNYRYIDTTGVVNTNSGTYTASSRGASLDMGASNSYRYVNTNGVPNSNSGTYTFPSGSGGTVDLGESNTYRYANAGNVYSYGVNVGKDSTPIWNVMVAAGMYGSNVTTSTNSVSLTNTNSAAVFVNVRNYTSLNIQTGGTAQGSIVYVNENGGYSLENKFNFTNITVNVSGVSFVLVTVYLSNGSSLTVTRS